MPREEGKPSVKVGSATTIIRRGARALWGKNDKAAQKKGSFPAFREGKEMRQAGRMGEKKMLQYSTYGRRAVSLEEGSASAL